MGKLGFIFCILWVTSACATIKPYEKEYLLHPTMDDGKVSALSGDMLGATCSQFEKLAGTGSGTVASSCPTCGG